MSDADSTIIILTFAKELIKRTIKNPDAHETKNLKCIENNIETMYNESRGRDGRRAIALEIHNILLDFRDASTETGHPEIY